MPVSAASFGASMGTVTVATMSIAWTNITAANGHTIFDITFAMNLGLLVLLNRRAAVVR